MRKFIGPLIASSLLLMPCLIKAATVPYIQSTNTFNSNGVINIASGTIVDFHTTTFTVSGIFIASSTISTASISNLIIADAVSTGTFVFNGSTISYINAVSSGTKFDRSTTTFQGATFKGTITDHSTTTHTGAHTFGVVSASSITTSTITLNTLTWPDGYIQKFKLYLNVKDPPYNAAGDGLTNDSTAINSALTATAASSATVFFPAGTYLTVGSHTVTTQTLLGEGKGATIMKKSSGANPIFVLNGAGVIQGMTLDSNNTVSPGIVVSTSSHGATKDILFTNVSSTYAFQMINQTQYLDAQDLEFRNNNWGNIYANNGGYYSTFQRTQMYGGQQAYGIKLETACTDITFYDTWMESPIDLTTFGIRDIRFSGITVRLDQMPPGGWFQAHYIPGSEVAQISIEKAFIFKRVAISSIPIFDVSLYQFYTNDIHIVDTTPGSAAGWSVIRDRGTNNFTMNNWTIESLNPWLLFSTNSTGGSFTAADTVNYTQGVVGTATWSNQVTPGGDGISSYVTVKNSNLMHNIASSNGDVTDRHRGGYWFQNISGAIDLTNTVGPVFVYTSSGPVTDPNNAVVGVYVSSAASGAPVPSSGANYDLVSILLNPGSWDISAINVVSSNGSTFNGVDYRMFISTVPGTANTGRVLGDNYVYSINVATNSFSGIALEVPTWRQSLTSPTTFYLKPFVNTYTAGTPTNFGRISAIRSVK